MATKVCKKCGVEKDLRDGFYGHAEMKDGALSKCKDCCKRDAKANRERNIDRIRQYDRERAKNPKRVAQITAATRSYRAANPDRFKANNMVNNAIRDGKMQKQPCVVCGSEKSHAHHDDYSKPLDVVWLCAVHHKERHACPRSR